MPTPLISYTAYVLTFFAIGFSGLSTHAQVASFAIPNGLSMKCYYKTKALVGLLNALFGVTISLLWDFK